MTIMMPTEVDIKWDTNFTYHKDQIFLFQNYTDPSNKNLCTL